MYASSASSLPSSRCRAKADSIEAADSTCILMSRSKSCSNSASKLASWLFDELVSTVQKMPVKLTATINTAPAAKETIFALIDFMESSLLLAFNYS